MKARLAGAFNWYKDTRSRLNENEATKRGQLNEAAKRGC